MTQALYEPAVVQRPWVPAADVPAAAPGRSLRPATGNPGRRPPRPLVTTEELAILTLMANGLTLDSVAIRVSVSPRTLSRRLRRVCNRLGVAHPIQAIVWAAREGLI